MEREVLLKLHERLDYGVKLNTVCAQVSAHFRLLVVVVAYVAYVAQVTNVSNIAFGRRRIHLRVSLRRPPTARRLRRLRRSSHERF